MAQNDMLKRYLDAGVAFTQMTRSKAEAIVKDLVKAGEVQREQTQSQVEELVERSRRNTEQLIDLVRREVRDQFKQMGVTRGDFARLEARVASLVPGRSAAKKRATATKSPAKPTAAKKAAPVKKKAAAPAKKAASAVKKATTGKKAPAKKAAGVKKA
jgi:polyhydroxyalkanoate synthesis regulator phasin